MQEALVALGRLGRLIDRQAVDEPGGIAHGIDHLALGEAGMDAHAPDGHERSARVEVLALERADFAAVERVGIGRAEERNVEVFRAAGHFLVGGEADAQARMRHLGMGLDPGDHLHDLGDARLVVGAQKRRAVREDHVLALVLQDVGELPDTEDDVLLDVERHVAAVVAHDLRPRVRARGVGRCVHVGDEADGGIGLAARRCGNRSVDHAALADPRVLDAERLELVDEERRKRKLLLGGRRGRALTHGLRVKRNILQEALGRAHALDGAHRIIS